MFNSQNLPKYIKIDVFYPIKQAHLESLSNNRFDSFHVSDLNGKRNQHRQFSNQQKYIKIDVFTLKKTTTLSILAYNVKKDIR